MNPYGNPAPSVKTIAIIHAALLAGQVLFAVIAFVIGPELTTRVNTADPLLIAVPVVVLASLLASNMLYKKFLPGANEGGNVPAKLVRYQTACIIRYALIEGPSLFAIVAFLLSRSAVFIIIAAALMIYFLTLRPTKETVAEELQLSYDEKMVL